MNIFGLSKRGLVRTGNEDKFYTDGLAFCILADGMGGHVGGEMASETVIAEVKSYVLADTSDWKNEVTLQEAVLAANAAIRRKVRDDSRLDGMGSTALVTYIEDGFMFWAHVGDSRIYLYGDGVLRQVTEDHSLVAQLIAAGEMTPEEAATHPSRHVITRSVGTEDRLEVDAGRVMLESGNMILMCSDGLTSMLADEVIRNTLIAHEHDAEGCVHELMRLVYEAGAKDNVTIIALLV